MGEQATPAQIYLVIAAFLTACNLVLVLINTLLLHGSFFENFSLRETITDLSFWFGSKIKNRKEPE